MINNLLEYKGYHTKIEFDAEDLILHGKIEGINDLVTFESESAENIIEEFHTAVDDYLEYCSRIGKEPDREFKGSFNVRLTSQIHKDAFYKALKKGLTLNNYILKTIEKDLYESTENNTTNIIVLSSDEVKNYSDSRSFQTSSLISNQAIQELWKN